MNHFFTNNNETCGISDGNPHAYLWQFNSNTPLKGGIEHKMFPLDHKYEWLTGSTQLPPREVLSIILPGHSKKLSIAEPIREAQLEHYRRRLSKLRNNETACLPIRVPPPNKRGSDRFEPMMRALDKQSDPLILKSTRSFRH